MPGRLASHRWRCVRAKPETPVSEPQSVATQPGTQQRAAKAIGVFTKITLKNQIDDLKVLTLLQDEDQKLASAIVSSRQAIWDLLADPKTFATLRV